ncbi:MAG: PEP-CTERM sorting domain-containing protein [Deltaproteobacteria bacterium]|nr:PEP-CTERM sorting domain-containing protein [Deltaproteobacteria bacterium]
MHRLELKWLTLLPILIASPLILEHDVRAATIALESSTPSVGSGELVEIRIYGSGFDEGTDGGDFALSWPSSLSFVALSIEDPPWDLSAYDAAGAVTGSISFVDVFSFIDTPGTAGVRFEIATLTLLAGAVGNSQIAIGPAAVGWSLAGSDLDTGYGPPVSIEILAVPEPTTGCLFGLGLALLCGRGQRRPI